MAIRPEIPKPPKTQGTHPRDTKAKACRWHQLKALKGYSPSGHRTSTPLGASSYMDKGRTLVQVPLCFACSCSPGFTAALAHNSCETYMKTPCPLNLRQPCGARLEASWLQGATVACSRQAGPAKSDRKQAWLRWQGNRELDVKQRQKTKVWGEALD